jgi:protein-S-isoprenylcysteine O-methyltransferase Ste14
MSVKENPELVTTGPYAHVRHPIYAGLCLAMLGSSLAHSTWWLVPFVFASGYFFYSARAEEKAMLKQFPDQYGAYVKRTKMFIPRVI